MKCYESHELPQKVSGLLGRPFAEVEFLSESEFKDSGNKDERN